MKNDYVAFKSEFDVLPASMKDDILEACGDDDSCTITVCPVMASGRPTFHMVGIDSVEGDDTLWYCNYEPTDDISFHIEAREVMEALCNAGIFDRDDLDWDAFPYPEEGSEDY